MKLELDLSSADDIMELANKLQKLYEDNKELLEPVFKQLGAICVGIADGKFDQIKSDLSQYDLATRVVLVTEEIEKLRQRNVIIENTIMTISKIAKLVLRAALA